MAASELLGYLPHPVLHGRQACWDACHWICITCPSLVVTIVVALLVLLEGLLLGLSLLLAHDQSLRLLHREPRDVLLLKELKDVGLRAVQVGGVDRLQVNDEV